jgi:uncharacterized protein YdgA (DUF945 family)
MTVRIRAFKPAEIELGEHIFKTVAPVRSRQIEISQKLEAADQIDDDDQAFELMCEVVCARLEPLGHKKQPLTILKELWKTDQISVQQLQFLMEDIAEAENPTQGSA